MQDPQVRSINGLVTQQAREGEQLDFKLKPHLPAMSRQESGSNRDIASGPTGQRHGHTGWKPEQEWAKDVCQFANHRGGLLLIGIRDADDVAVAARPFPDDPAALEQRLRVVLGNYSAPTPRIDVIIVPSAAGGSYMAVVVPPSELGPHAVTDGTSGRRRPLHFPVRHGADTRWMDEAEVADRYRRRSLARYGHEIALKEAVEAGADQLRLASGLWLYVATNPEAPAGARLDGGVCCTDR